MELEDVTPPATHLPEPDIDRIGGVSAFEHLVTGEGMTLVHASRCLLVKGKDVRPVGVRDLEKLGLDRCGVCLR
jgi:hypothetical protein